MIFLDKHNILYMCTKWVWPARLTANHHETSCPSYRDTCLLVCFVFEASFSSAAERLLEYAAISTTVLHVVVCLISLFHAHAQCCCSAYVTGYWGQWTAKLALCTEFGRWPTVIFIPGYAAETSAIPFLFSSTLKWFTFISNFFFRTAKKKPWTIAFGFSQI